MTAELDEDRFNMAIRKFLKHGRFLCVKDRPASELCRRRCKQSNGCACALSIRKRPGHALSHPRHEPARMDRTCDFVGLHPVDQRGCDRSLQPGEDGLACGGAGTEAGSVSYHLGQRPIKPSDIHGSLNPICARADIRPMPAFMSTRPNLKRVSNRLNHSLVASCAGLTRASIYFAKSLLKLDGLPGQGPAMTPACGSI